MAAPKLIEINGQQKSISAWSKVYGRSAKTVCYRIKIGWEPLKALSTPDSRAMYLTVNGQKRSLKSWAKRIGITSNAIVWRLENGWTPEEAIQPRVFSPFGLTAFGRTQLYREWAEEYSINEATLYRRINVMNMTPEAALTVPVKRKEEN